tara:strand:- start:2882 stop:3682 length:801 start_codon:yes stop_codon:yes gene_type:complete
MSDFDLTGQTALVTGSGRGIGKGCALELARAGADVIINDLPGSPDLEATATEIRAIGRQCYIVAEDAFSQEGVQRIFDSAIEQAGDLDILVSNPAYTRRAEFLELDPEDWEKTLQGTLSAGFRISQLVARHLVQRGRGGSMIFISSVQAVMPIGLSVAYNAAKAGTDHMMKTIAMELAGHRINVNSIQPGWIDTPKERETWTEEAIVEQGQLLPWGRLGTPVDIGKAAVFLASDAADYITCVTLPVDGGFRHRDCGVSRVEQMMQE